MYQDLLDALLERLFPAVQKIRIKSANTIKEAFETCQVIEDVDVSLNVLQGSQAINEQHATRWLWN